METIFPCTNAYWFWFDLWFSSGQLNCYSILIVTLSYPEPNSLSMYLWKINWQWNRISFELDWDAKYRRWYTYTANWIDRRHLTFVDLSLICQVYRIRMFLKQQPKVIILFFINIDSKISVAPVSYYQFMLCWIHSMKASSETWLLMLWHLASPG